MPNGYFTAPAVHAAGNLYGTDNIMGMRIRLKANFDVSKFSTTNQIILNAMKKYGMILADNGSNMFFQGTPDPRWNDNDLQRAEGGSCERVRSREDGCGVRRRTRRRQAPRRSSKLYGIVVHCDTRSKRNADTQRDGWLV